MCTYVPSYSVSYKSAYLWANVRYSSCEKNQYRSNFTVSVSTLLNPIAIIVLKLCAIEHNNKNLAPVQSGPFFRSIYFAVLNVV